MCEHEWVIITVQQRKREILHLCKAVNLMSKAINYYYSSNYSCHWELGNNRDHDKAMYDNHHAMRYTLVKISSMGSPNWGGPTHIMYSHDVNKQILQT